MNLNVLLLFFILLSCTQNIAETIPYFEGEKLESDHQQVYEKVKGELTNQTYESEKMKEELTNQTNLSQAEPEPIVFALNKDYASKTSDWKERADLLIEYLNSVFAKTTDKRYKIAKYAVYDDRDYENLWTDQASFDKLVRDATTNAFGTFIITMIHRNRITGDEIQTFSPSLTVNVGGIERKSGNTLYKGILLAYPEERNFLLSKPGEIDSYPQSAEILVHEIGHTNGLAVPDWYLYEYSDCTGTEPILPDFSIKEIYPHDPMTQGSTEMHKFSHLNSQIINLNLDHKYDYNDITGWHAKRAAVLVTDSNQKPIPGATVRVFCIRKNCFYCKSSCANARYGSGVVNSDIPEQILQTDASGTVHYEPPSGEWHFEESDGTKCLAKAIKVYHQGKSAAKYVNFLDLQEDKVLHDKDLHVDHLVIG